MDIGKEKETIKVEPLHEPKKQPIPQKSPNVPASPEKEKVLTPA